MKTIKIWNDRPSESQLNEICSAIESGEVVILPTDSVYAIVGDALSSKVIDRICRIKGINPDKEHLAIICSDISMAAEYARIENEAFRLIKDNTPGAFTFLLRAASSLPKAFKGRKTVGIRIPDCDVPRLVAERIGHPLITTGIEFDDDDYAISPSLIAENYEGQVDLMVEGEEGGTLFTTIVDCMQSPPEIVREGAGELV